MRNAVNSRHDGLFQAGARHLLKEALGQLGLAKHPARTWTGKIDRGVAYTDAGKGRKQDAVALTFLAIATPGRAARPGCPQAFSEALNPALRARCR